MSDESKELIKDLLSEFIESAGGYLEYDLKNLDVSKYKKALDEFEKMKKENDQLKEKIQEAIKYCEMEEPLLAIDIMSK